MQVAMKIAEGSMGPGGISAVRFLLAAAVFLPAILRALKVPALRNAGAELGCWLFGEDGFEFAIFLHLEA